MTDQQRLRKVGPIEGRTSQFSTVTELLERESPDYVRGYFRGAVALARQLDASGTLAKCVRVAIELNLVEHPELLEQVRADWGQW